MFTPKKQDSDWPKDVAFFNWRMITQKQFDQEYVLPLLQCNVPMNSKITSICTDL